MHNKAKMPVKEALKQTAEISKELTAAEEELTIAHAVLKTKLPHSAKDDDVDKAVDMTAQAKKRVRKSTKRLAVVKAVLTKEASK